ncbi:MAG: hypothetical protein V3W35_09590 [Gemmatimonadota bacterium]
MKRFTHRLSLASLPITLTLLASGPLRAQSSTSQTLREAADITEVSAAPGMAEFLRSQAAQRHCCKTEEFLQGAILYKRAAEHGLDGNSENLEAAVEDLRLAGYFFYYAGEFDRAFNALARVGVIERDSGNRTEAAEAFLEAAHIARQRGDLQRARELLVISERATNKP